MYYLFFIQNPTPHIYHLNKGAKYGLYFMIYKKLPTGLAGGSSLRL